MAKLPEAVKEAISNEKVFSVATSNKENMPNVIYIGCLKIIDDETIVIADNYLCKTRENILDNEKIAFAVRDEKKGSYQVKGTAERVTEGTLFDDMMKWVPERLPREAAIVMHVEEVYNGAEKLC